MHAPTWLGDRAERGPLQQLPVSSEQVHHTPQPEQKKRSGSTNSMPQHVAGSGAVKTREGLHLWMKRQPSPSAEPRWGCSGHCGNLLHRYMEAAHISDGSCLATAHPLHHTCRETTLALPSPCGAVPQQGGSGGGWRH